MAETTKPEPLTANELRMALLLLKNGSEPVGPNLRQVCALAIEELIRARTHSDATALALSVCESDVERAAVLMAAGDALPFDARRAECGCVNPAFEGHTYGCTKYQIIPAPTIGGVR